MADTVVAGKLTLDGSQAQRSVRDFKKELREANVDLIQMQKNFGELSPEAIQAAKNVAMLKDRVQEAKEVTELFDPGKKFAVFGNVLRTVAGGFSALTGAAALFGAESEDLQKTLLKVQGALALTEGVNTIVDSAKDFARLKTVALDALKSIRIGIAATGLGAVAVILGTIVAYWDDIKELVTGVSGEQKDILNTTTKQSEVENEKLKAIGDQDNILKLQGKTEKEILEIKVKQVDATIAAGEAQLEAQKGVVQAQVDTANRNKSILKGILDFVNQPIIMILRGVDAVRMAFGKVSTLATDMNESIANFFFDPKEAQEEGQKTIDEINKNLNALKNQRAGFLLSIREINKQEAEKRRQDELKEAEEWVRMTEMQREELLKRLKQQQLFDADFNRIRKENAEKNKSEFDDFARDGMRAQNDLMQVYADIRQENKSAEQIQHEERLGALQFQYEQRMSLIRGNEEAELIITRQYEAQKTEIERQEYNARLGVIGSFFGRAAELFGQNTIAYKALAIAQATINTYIGVSDALAAKTFTIFDTVAKFVNAGLILASGLANVKKIASVQVAGFSGGSSVSGGGSVSVGAPLQSRPTVQNTQLPQNQINQLGNATVRAYVLENEISTSQERIRRLNRAAVLGE